MARRSRPPAADDGGNANRYYASSTDLKGGYREKIIPPLPAEPLEQLVILEVEQLIHQPTLLMQIFQHCHEQESELSYDQTVAALHTLKTIWQELFPNEQQRIAQLLIDRIEVQTHNLRIRFHTEGIPEITEDLQGVA